MIFTFKEEEKARKTELRRVNSGRRIYEKNRPTREGILRQIRETDIDPSKIKINPRYQKRV